LEIPHNLHQSKIAKTLAILSKIKYILDSKALKILYQSLIVPYMTYCVEVWGNTYKTTIKPKMWNSLDDENM